jgi:hypothetical protein
VQIDHALHARDLGRGTSHAPNRHLSPLSPATFPRDVLLWPWKTDLNAGLRIKATRVISDDHLDPPAWSPPTGELPIALSMSVELPYPRSRRTPHGWCGKPRPTLRAFAG